MRFPQAIWMFLAIIVAWGLWPGAVQARLRLCNQSYDVLNVALAQPHAGSDDHDRFATRGWWRVAPGQCATLLRDRLQARYFYLFAMDVFGKEALSGAIPLCVGPRRFVIERQGDCLLRGHLDARFIEVDTGDQDDWTVFVAQRSGW